MRKNKKNKKGIIYQNIPICVFFKIAILAHIVFIYLLIIIIIIIISFGEQMEEINPVQKERKPLYGINLFFFTPAIFDYYY